MAPSVFKLSKIKYYLVDNIYCFMLSQLIGRVQEESKRAGVGPRRVIRERTDVALLGDGGFDCNGQVSSIDFINRQRRHDFPLEHSPSACSRLIN